VAEVGVGRDREDLDAQALQRRIGVSQIFQLRRADEGEIGRIEEEDGPFALYVGVGDVAKGLIVVLMRAM